MDAFFSGLDSRLRMSVKLGDSIMMGLVNAAMEDAYKKSLSKEGDLERLIEKLRFGELATLQLEWCLRFVRGEMECNGVESTGDHEQLLDDLLETRDGIQARLEESVLAVAEKDRDFMRRKEIESRLRLALEMKGEEVSSLLAMLGPERTKDEQVSELVRPDEIRGEEDGHMFGELRSSADQQMSRMRGKLENGRCTLADLMQKLGSSSSPTGGLNSGHNGDGDGMNALSDLYIMAQLLMEFEEMILDATAVKASIASSFEMMERSISLFKTTLDEQQWVMNAERDIYSGLVENFLKELQFETASSLPIAIRMNWSALMDDITTLQNELELLVSETGMKPEKDDNPKVGTNDQSNPKVGTNYQSMSRTMYIQASEDMSEGQLVAKLMNNHETIIQKRSQEINLSKIDLSREKGSRCIENDRTFDAVKASASHVIARLKAIRNGNARISLGGQSLSSNNDDDRNENCLEGFEPLNNETRLRQSARHHLEQSSNGSCHLVSPGVSDDEVVKLIEDKTDADIICELQNEINKTTFRDLVREVTAESFDHFVETIVANDIHTVAIAETFNEWKNLREMIENERLIKEEVDWVIFGQLTKDLTCHHDLCMHEAHSMIEQMEQLHELRLAIDEPREDKGVDLNHDPKFMKPNILNNPENCDARDSKGSEVQVETLTDRDANSDSVNGKIVQALQQADSLNLQISEVAFPLSMPLDSRNLENDQADSQLYKKHEVRHSPAASTASSENNQDGLREVLVPFANFSQRFTLFEAVASKKIGNAILRLEDLNKQQILLVKQVSSLKRNEFLYRRAFTRRCYDLQTAEAEVDLLGDEVDLLLGLLKKTYIALDKYSPVLQNYFGVMLDFNPSCK